MHEGRKQTNTWSAYAGSRLELSDALGRRRPKRHPSSRIGENPPYGMTGGIEETSASFEARSAPRSYPTYGNWDDGCGQTTLVPRCNATVPASSKSAISAGTCCPKSPPITRGDRGFESISLQRRVIQTRSSRVRPGFRYHFVLFAGLGDPAKSNSNRKRDGTSRYCASVYLAVGR